MLSSKFDKVFPRSYLIKHLKRTFVLISLNCPNTPELRLRKENYEQIYTIFCYKYLPMSYFAL